MNYNKEFRKFITGQNLSIGIRITACILIPSLVLYHVGLLDQMLAIPLGALCVSLSDNPGPPNHRKNGILVSLVINFIVAAIVGYSKTIHGLMIVEIVAFSMFFTLISVYGSRAAAIGSIALIVFIFNADTHTPSHTIQNALLFTAGGIWYAIVCAVLYQLRPYKMVQQQIGDCLIDTANYLKIKASFYDKNPDEQTLTKELIRYQVQIQEKHAELREVIFKTRRILSESTTKGRILMLMFLDSVDLFERIMTSQQDYATLHKAFADKDVLHIYQRMIVLLSEELHEIGLAIQGSTPSTQLVNLDEELQLVKIAYNNIKEQSASNETEPILMLKLILSSMQDVNERIKRLHGGTTYDTKLNTEYKREEDLDLKKFIDHQAFSPQLLWDNISLQSSHFRHAVRLTVALLTGYIVSLLLPFGHGYWVLLTIATIIRPAYGITKARNIQRLSGTLIGGTISFVAIYLLHNNITALFCIMLIAMTATYAFLKLNYLVSCASITIYVLLCFYFLSPSHFEHILIDRVIDTAIGSCIAFVIPLFILPSWAKDTISVNMMAAVKSNRKYFDTIGPAFVGKPADVTSYKLARKNAFVSLANLSSDFQRMLSEPKDKRPSLKHYHQFATANHMLTSHIAALSYYAQRKAHKYASPEFMPLIQQIDMQFGAITELLKQDASPATANIDTKHSISDKVQELLTSKTMQLKAEGIEQAEIQRVLREIKTITTQFELISTMTIDEVRILKKLFAS